MKVNPRKIFLFIIISLGVGSCISEDAPFDILSEPQVFLQDTVSFDTLLINTSSPSKRYKIVNPGGNNITINSIKLSSGTSSPFTLIIKGQKGKEFSNVKLRGGDSLEILIEAYFTSQNTKNPVPVYDDLIIDNLYSNPVVIEGFSQDVKVLDDFIFRNDTTIKSGSRIHIKNNAYIDSLVNVNVEPDVIFFMGNNSRLLVKGGLNIEGTFSEKVIFIQSRQDGVYEITPGQWDGIYFLENSLGSTINNVIIKNATFGLRLGDPDESETDLIIKNTQIINSLSHGILAFSTDFDLENVVVGEAGEQAFSALGGGNINIIHSTINAGSGVLAIQNPVTGFSDNIPLSDGSTILKPLNLLVKNSIIWSPYNSSVIIQEVDSQNNSISFSSNIFGWLDIDQSYLIDINLVDEDPLFTDAGEFDYSIKAESPAINFCLPEGVTNDILGKDRDSAPDAGAFEFIGQ
ncbi:hypothetical protein [Marinigracilibium pacificum]|uniref:Right handed beta helix domain-containing protein n=1 Tax=Marinigracilibium pacificum TaxID=2729599 RepID=A0A848IRC0_9BACT|nr:hypothetical protein [Marinigracilibium pacificum]NMM47013.1 hypothetical protein [Marinigracilibium pacificum]